VSVAGGDAPFTWVVLSGTLPPGLALNGSTSGVTDIQGTPTTAGPYSFTLQATDTLSRVATVALSMTVNPQATCVLSGRFALQFSGYRGGGPATHIAAISIDSNGVVTGEQDYKDPTRTTTAETLSPGTCTNRETNTGVLTLLAPSGKLVYNFAATPPDTAGIIHSARLQLISSGSDSGSGQMLLQDPTAITATPPSGNFAFGLIGADPSALHFGEAGRFTSDATGTLSAGLIDSNAVTPLTAATLTGALSAPDANGRGTLTLASGSQSTTLAYYLVNAGKAYLMDIDPTTSGASTRLAGQMTAQVGDASPTVFDSAALATPSIVSLFGAVQGADPVTVMSLGRLSNANAAAGTVDMALDTSDQAADIGAEPFTGQSYTVDPSGRGVLSLAEATGAVSFVFYLDGVSNGYLIDQGSTAGSAGFLEAQFQGPYASPPPTGIFPPTLSNAFVSGTAYPQAPGPISLEPLVYLNFDALSSNFFNGSFAIDPSSGRGLGTLVDNGIGSTAAVLYIVSPSKMDILRFGTAAIDGSIEFLIQN
ncbi:MAG: putative Ig domain-containing protein, partial [Terriglobales bacterium]